MVRGVSRGAGSGETATMRDDLTVPMCSQHVHSVPRPTSAPQPGSRAQVHSQLKL